MKKVFNYGLFVLILSFVFINNVNAECSYQERKSLLNDAKSVDISFDVVSEEKEMTGINPNTEEEETFTTTVYTFKMNVVGMTNNMFAKITNNYDSSEIIVNYNDMKDGMYSINIENTTDIITYYVDFYSTNDNCYADKIKTTTVKKPKINPVYYYSVCSNEEVEDSEYCKQFIDKEFSKNVFDIVKELNDRVDAKEKIEEKKGSTFIAKSFSFIMTYWYLFVGILLLIIGMIVVLLIRRKRSKL